ncbi:MAG: hypothetical protein QOD44_1308 [Solirubrobacteraceae bacterium]|nr:hypothetical protein [Solirubrobacteraceae bacterium]
MAAPSPRGNHWGDVAPMTAGPPGPGKTGGVAAPPVSGYRLTTKAFTVAVPRVFFVAPPRTWTT